MGLCSVKAKKLLVPIQLNNHLILVEAELHRDSISN